MFLEYGGGGLGSITDCDLDGYCDLVLSQADRSSSVCLRSHGTGLTATLIKKQEVTSTVPGLSAQTRTVEHVLDTNNPLACRMRQQIVEPNDTTNELRLTTSIDYDALGHASSQQVSAANIETRTVTTGYGVRGVFPESVRLGNPDDPLQYGRLVSSITDANGNVTTRQTDAIGLSGFARKERLQSAPSDSR